MLELSVEGLFSTGSTPSSLNRKKKRNKCWYVYTNLKVFLLGQRHAILVGHLALVDGRPTHTHSTPSHTVSHSPSATVHKSPTVHILMSGVTVSGVRCHRVRCLVARCQVSRCQVARSSATSILAAAALVLASWGGFSAAGLLQHLSC